MSSHQQQSNAVGTEELARLIAKAREAGQADAFLGKRQWVRYQVGLRLEVTTGGAASADTWAAVMHNISGGGFGFWSRRKFNEGDCIFVREWSESRSGEWMPAWVTHCTTGIQGHLVGARFEYPCDPDDPHIINELADAQHEDGHVSSDPAPPAQRLSLQARCTLATATATVVGILVASWAFWIGSKNGWNLLFCVLTLLGVCGLAAVAGWRLIADELRFLRVFRSAMHDVAQERSDPSEIERAPSREMDALRRAFLTLGARWRQRANDERAQRQKLEEVTQIKSNILSIVSHDLRTPLTSILLYTQMLREELDALGKEDQDRFLGIISDECNRLSRLVDDLLEVQRLESDRVRWDMKPQDLTGTIRAGARVFEALAKSKSIELTIDCPDSLPPAEADADKISQVLSNLMSNALKYTPNGGKVHLSAEARGGEILLRVADSGPGIPRDKWDQIFDRFSQLADPNVSEIDGFGLGLYIVKRIVERHGGAAWVDSGVGHGSEFWISLPTQTSDIKTDQDQEATTTAGRILVCDPDPALAAMVSQTLRWHGYDVRLCHSGCRLLAQLAHGDVDVVVTDVLLPDMDATEVLQAINTMPDQSFRLIIHSYAGDSTDFTGHGVDMFLRRPVSKEDLLEAIQSVMNKQREYGRSILLIGGGGLDAEVFESALASASHTVLVAGNLEAAAQRLSDFSIDTVAVSATVLGEKWSELAKLWEVARDGVSFLVLCDAVRKRERQLAEDHHVEAIAYRPGSEKNVISALVAPEPCRMLELNA